MGDKRSIRQTAKAALAGLSPDQQREASAAICTCLAALPEWGKAARIAAFHPLPGEPDILPALKARPGEEIHLPRVDEDHLQFYPAGDWKSLVPSRWGVMEPAPGAGDSADSRDLQLVLVPGLAFTRSGHRLGRGAGLYDRFLASLPEETPIVGIAFEVQLMNELPQAPHDHPVHKILTESALYEASPL